MSAIDALQVADAVRDPALQYCRSQFHACGITMPKVEPLVMDFGLGDFKRFGLIEYWIANEIEAGYCGKYMFVTDGQMCPKHFHQTKHETFFVVHGQLAVTLGDKALELAQGQTLAITPGSAHSFKGIGDTLMIELSMPCDVVDNYFEDTRTMDWLGAAFGKD
jgi:D-lyxose ketol-isomerase